MKKLTLLLILSLLFATSCNQNSIFKPSAADLSELARKDSIALADSIINISGTPASRMFKRIILDTTGMYRNPIKVESADIVKNTGYSGGVFIKLKFTNTSDKIAQAIVFEYFCENAFFEPAYLGAHAMSDGYTINTYLNLVNPKQTVTHKIYIDSDDPKSILVIRANRVSFTDRTKFVL